MRFRFYVGEGEKAVELIGLIESGEARAQVYRSALVEEMGAESLLFFPTWPGKPQGFLYPETVEKAGLKMGASVASGIAYFPDTNTEEGRKIRDALFDERLEFDAETELIRAIGMWIATPGYCAVCDNIHAVYKTCAYFLGKIPKIFVRVPVDEMLIPVGPAWLREVKESEWLAAQGR